MVKQVSSHNIILKALLQNINRPVLIVNNYNREYFYIMINNDYLNKISVLIRPKLIKSFQNLLTTKNKIFYLLNVLAK